MGLTIQNSITLKNGMQASNVYLCFNNQPVTIFPGLNANLTTGIDGGKSLSANSWTISAQYYLYTSNTAMLNKCTPLESNTVCVPIMTSMLSTPAHQILYDYIKENIFTSAIDC